MPSGLYSPAIVRSQWYCMEDENDDPPIFQNDSYYVTIPEADYTPAVRMAALQFQVACNRPLDC